MKTKTEDKDTIEELVSEINNLNGGKTEYTLDQLFNDHELGMCVGLDKNFSGDEHRKAHQRFREMTKEWVRQALTKAKQQGEKIGEERMKRAKKQTDEYFKLREEKLKQQGARDERERLHSLFNDYQHECGNTWGKFVKEAKFKINELTGGTPNH